MQTRYPSRLMDVECGYVLIDTGFPKRRIFAGLAVPLLRFIAKTLTWCGAET